MSLPSFDFSLPVDYVATAVLDSLIYESVPICEVSTS